MTQCPRHHRTGDPGRRRGRRRGGHGRPPPRQRHPARPPAPAPGRHRPVAQPDLGAHVDRAPRSDDARRARRPRAGGAAQHHPGGRQARSSAASSCASPTRTTGGSPGCPPRRRATRLLADVRARKDLWLASRLAELDDDQRARLAAALDVIDALTSRERAVTPVARAKGAARETFASLQHRNFRLFFTGQLISQVGNWLTLVAQTLLVLELTDSGDRPRRPRRRAVRPDPACSARGPGLVADRSDKRRLLLIVQTVAMAPVVRCWPRWRSAASPPVGAIYAVAVARRRQHGVRQPGPAQLRGRDGRPPTRINNAVSLNSALMTSSRVVGPGAGRPARRRPSASAGRSSSTACRTSP